MSKIWGADYLLRFRGHRDGKSGNNRAKPPAADGGDTEDSSSGAEGKQPPKPAGRNSERDFHGEKRSNATQASITDPDARLYKKALGQAAKLCHMRHVTMENHNGLVVGATLTHATGSAEREAAMDMVGRMDGRHRIPLAAD